MWIDQEHDVSFWRIITDTFVKHGHKIQDLSSISGSA